MTIKHGRVGVFGGQVCKFTHRDPKSGQVWSDNIPVQQDAKGHIEYGMWVDPSSVKWMD